jgi:hypothetical protein
VKIRDATNKYANGGEILRHLARNTTKHYRVRTEGEKAADETHKLVVAWKPNGPAIPCIHINGGTLSWKWYNGGEAARFVAARVSRGECCMISME